MSTWFTDLAGKAENILNKIDQNAASVLKSDSGEKSQLLNGQTNGDTVSIRHAPSPAKQISASPSLMKLTQPKGKKTRSNADDADKSDGRHHLSATNGDDGMASTSNASNSSRRSSWSSKTEGVQSVIEMPLSKGAPANGTGHTSAASLATSMDERNEMVAIKIVLAQIKCERDQLKGDITELKQQLATAQNEHVIADLQAQCDRLAADKERLQHKVDEIESGNKHQSKTISELEVTMAMLRERENDLGERLRLAKYESEQSAAELQQYRARAQQTLQSKDDMIAELKALHQKADEGDDGEVGAQVMQIERNKLADEHTALVDELNALRSQLSAKKHIISTLEAKCQGTDQRHQDYEAKLLAELKQERIKCSQLEESVRMQTRELEAVRDELKRHHVTMAAKLHEKYGHFCWYFRR